MRFKLMPATSILGVEFQQLVFVCMGCNEVFGGGIQAIPVNTKAVWPAWTWDGDLIKPSIEEEIMVVAPFRVCRSTLTEGIFRYHPDSTHSYSGLNGYAQPFPEWYVENLALQEMAPNN
jgi:hypothetical protein